VFANRQPLFRGNPGAPTEVAGVTSPPPDWKSIWITRSGNPKADAVIQPGETVRFRSEVWPDAPVVPSSWIAMGVFCDYSGPPETEDKVLRLRGCTFSQILDFDPSIVFAIEK